MSLNPSYSLSLLYITVKPRPLVRRSRYGNRPPVYVRELARLPVVRNFLGGAVRS